MTCIVGLKTPNDVWLGVDSAGANRFTSHVYDTPKMIVRKRLVMGYTSTFRFGNLLAHNLKIPKVPPKAKSLERWMVRKFIPALRECLKDAGHNRIEHSLESGGTCLVATRKTRELFIVQSDFSILTPVEFASVGSGCYHADAAMHVLSELSDMKPRKKVRKALEAAAWFVHGVRPPFDIKSLSEIYE